MAGIFFLLGLPNVIFGVGVSSLMMRSSLATALEIGPKIFYSTVISTELDYLLLLTGIVQLIAESMKLFLLLSGH